MWNKAFEMVLNLKESYLKKFGSIDEYDLERWANELGDEKSLRFLSNLKLTYYENMVLLRYDLNNVGYELWREGNSIYRQCRSLVIDLEDENIVLSPFEKFFNLNEVEETKEDVIRSRIKEAKVFEISNKLDGSMISARWYENSLVLSSSMSLDRSKSWRLNDAYRMAETNDNLTTLLMEHNKYTFMFEYISLEDAHTVSYKKEDEGLYLIGAIDVDTGKELSYYSLRRLANVYSLPSTSIEEISFPQMLQMSKTISGYEKEGWVLNIDGLKVKVKCDDYICLSKIIGGLISDNTIISSIADDTFDDLLSKVSNAHREYILNKATKIFNYHRLLNHIVNSLYEKRASDDRKEFMIWCDTQDKSIKKYLRFKYLGMDYSPLKIGNKYVKMQEVDNFLNSYS